MSATGHRILVVEDEHDLALGIKVNLEVEGYAVELAHTLADGTDLLDRTTPDLLVLDLMLPDGDGFALLAGMRARGDETPVLILTARAQEVDKVRGFRAGADDYVTKPFGVMELLVRIEALLRRAAPRGRDGAPAAAERIGPLTLIPGERVLRHRDRDVALTPKAVELLQALARRRGRVLSRQELLREVWRYDASVTTRTVDAHIAELRRKLGMIGADPQIIDTVWKAGYRLRV